MKKILVLLLLTSCSAQHQLDRLLKKHPELAKTTVVKEVHRDTLVSKEIHKDSVINNIYSKDTVFIREGKETVKYVYEGGSKAYISGDVKADTIIKIDTVKSKTTTLIQQVKAPKTTLETIEEWFFWIVLALIAGTILSPYIKKFIQSKL